MALTKPNKTRMVTTLPDGKTIAYTLFTKADEKIMLILKESDDMNSRIQAVADIVERCSDVDPKTAPKWLTEYMYLVLRRDSIGQEIEFSVTVKDSVAPVEVVVDLSRLNITGKMNAFDGKADLSEWFDSKAIIEFNEPTIFDFAVGGGEEKAGRLLWNSLKAWHLGDETTMKEDMAEEEFLEWVDDLEGAAFAKIDKVFSAINNVECGVKFDGEEERLKDLLNFIILE